jgi:hypothetical protein
MDKQMYAQLHQYWHPSGELTKDQQAHLPGDPQTFQAMSVWPLMAPLPSTEPHSSATKSCTEGEVGVVSKAGTAQ